jgi:hypothetical protein
MHLTSSFINVKMSRLTSEVGGEFAARVGIFCIATSVLSAFVRLSDQVSKLAFVFGSEPPQVHQAEHVVEIGIAVISTLFPSEVGFFVSFTFFIVNSNLSIKASSGL